MIIKDYILGVKYATYCIKNKSILEQFTTFKSKYYILSKKKSKYYIRVM